MLIMALCFLFISHIESQDETTRVLFVGNSYTYFWNLPQHVEIMAESSGDSMITFQSTAGGSHWGHHWRGDRDLRTIEKIKNEAYDIVVLQNHSMSTFNRKDSLRFFGSKLNELAVEAGSKVYLYESWSRRWDPYMQEVISASYKQFGNEIEAEVIPVGQAWSRAIELRPDFQLYDPDGSHPNPIGTYLSACVIYSVLTDKSPVGLPNRLISKDHKGEKIYYNILPAGDALFCQKVAEEIVKM